MRRNSSIIGPLQETDEDVQNGVYDIFDVYNHTLVDAFPKAWEWISLIAQYSVIDEGQTNIFYLSTKNISAGDILYRKINAVVGTVNDADISSASTGGGTVWGSFESAGDNTDVNIRFTAETAGTGFGNENDQYNLTIYRGNVSGGPNPASSEIVLTSTTVLVEDVEATSLYDFTSFTFGTGGLTIQHIGPTKAQLLANYNTTTYPWLNDTAYYDAGTGIDQGIQLWSPPADGDYKIDAYGSCNSSGSYRGEGVTVTIGLTTDDTLQIVCGHRGTRGTANRDGGGGASWVYQGTTLYAVGGGAGGNQNAPTYTSNSNSGNGSGGTGDFYDGALGGAGWLGGSTPVGGGQTDGWISGVFSSKSKDYTGGYTSPQGSAGRWAGGVGIRHYYYGYGGYGGGGGGIHPYGGGAGYTGANAGTSSVGYGGTSWTYNNAGSSLGFTSTYANGSVTITKL